MSVDWIAQQVQDERLEFQTGVMVERIAAASDTFGSDTAGLADLAELLGADWLPPASLAGDA